jgi:hypothetical protein
MCFNNRHLAMALVSVVYLAISCRPMPTAGPMPPPAASSTPVETFSAETSTPAPTSEARARPTVPPAATNVRVADIPDYYFSPLLPFDSIAPVYDPRFVAATDSPLWDDELVLAITVGGEAKAYPITVLRFREMVNDQLGGIPILVTW